MASKYKKKLSLAGRDFSKKTTGELKELLNKTLEDGIHGLCFSPYVGDQGPGHEVTEDQIQERLDIIKSYTDWIRTFSCTEGNENIPKIAKKNGLKVLCGIWIGDNDKINEKEIRNGIKLAQNGDIDILAVGNEVLLREDIPKDKLVDYINRVKREVPDNIPVGYVDAYYEFEQNPKVTEACDVILANCYPFWEGCALEYSTLYMKDMYRRAVKAGKGKKVIITETGWPDMGSDVWGAKPSVDNAYKYFLNTYKWAQEEGIEIFYFSSFDEDWKEKSEGDVGSRWGLWDKDGNLKI
ncbi:MAG: glycosyl hydrolase family 17 protein [Fusobacteriota bacterium]